MNTVSPETRARNRVTFILLVLFAVGLCAYVLVSMHVHARRLQQQQGEGAHTSPATSLHHPSSVAPPTRPTV